jgi:hypothetical protein
MKVRQPMKHGLMALRETIMLSVFSNQEATWNDALKLELAKYVADYVMEEQERGNLEVIMDDFRCF